MDCCSRDACKLDEREGIRFKAGSMQIWNADMIAGNVKFVEIYKENTL